MKKVIALLMALILVLSMAACTNSNGNTENNTANNNVAEEKLDWPKEGSTIELILPAGTNGDVNFIGRWFADELSKRWNCNIVCTNMQGSGGSVGSDRVRTADPDGYTMLFNNSQFCVSQAQGLVDWGAESFEIAAISGMSSGMVFCTNKNHHFKDAKELIEYTKAHPNEEIVGTAVGTPSHMYTLALLDAGAALRPVSYSAGERQTNIMAGEILGAFCKCGTDTENFIAQGEFVPVFIAQKERNPRYPNVPTSVECGYPNIVWDDMMFFAFPKNTDERIVQKLCAELEDIVLHTKSYADYIATFNGTEPYFVSRDNGAAQVLIDAEKEAARLIKLYDK